MLFYGKEIKIEGRKFYVESGSSYCTATDGETGLGCGQICDLETRIEKIMENISKCNIPPLDSLPEGEFDEKTHKVGPKKND